ncbi:MAG TPA: hypothetical protein PKB06_06930 [Actinotalea sp.]|nr:hypothetical protein [Actinotalea sp.]
MVDVGGVRLGAERPATVVPLTGVDLSALLAQAAQVAGAGPDLVEWRVDLAPGLLADAGAPPFAAGVDEYALTVLQVAARDVPAARALAAAAGSA